MFPILAAAALMIYTAVTHTEEPVCELHGTEVKTVIVETAAGGKEEKVYEPICLKELAE